MLDALLTPQTIAVILTIGPGSVLVRRVSVTGLSVSSEATAVVIVIPALGFVGAAFALTPSAAERAAPSFGIDLGQGRRILGSCRPDMHDVGLHAASVA